MEAVHAMAPGANIVFAGGKNCGGGLDTAWASVIDNHLASVVTDSWNDNTEALPTGVIDFYHEYLLEAATTGITVMFSSGDDGDEVASIGHQAGVAARLRSLRHRRRRHQHRDRPGREHRVPGRLVELLCQPVEESTWTPKPPGTFSSGSGGGTSVVYSQPFYQVGVVPDKISKYNGKTPMRAVPDVAMPADPDTGLEIGETQQFPDGTYYATYRLGGTSLSSPLFAGVVADAQQFNGSPSASSTRCSTRTSALRPSPT